MHKSATKCNETLSKWFKNKHGASKIIDTLETYQGYIVVLSINKSVEPNEEQKVLTRGFDQGFTVNNSKWVFRGIW
jgi:hypothetical protein